MVWFKIDFHLFLIKLYISCIQKSSFNEIVLFRYMFRLMNN